MSEKSKAVCPEEPMKSLKPRGTKPTKCGDYVELKIEGLVKNRIL